MILEYKLHMTPGGMRAPDWVEDGGYFKKDNKYIGWASDNVEYYIPSTVNVLTAEELETRVVEMHVANPFTYPDGDEQALMTEAQVREMVQAWVSDRSS